MTHNLLEDQSEFVSTKIDVFTTGIQMPISLVKTSRRPSLTPGLATMKHQNDCLIIISSVIMYAFILMASNNDLIRELMKDMNKRN